MTDEPRWRIAWLGVCGAYWSRDRRWTGRDTADVFRESEIGSVRLPPGGVWTRA